MEEQGGHSVGAVRCVERKVSVRISFIIRTGYEKERTEGGNAQQESMHSICVGGDPVEQK